MAISRREACLLLGGVVFAADIKFHDDPFTLGIASGDPWPDGFVLWTRLAPPGGIDAAAVPVKWAIASDERMSHVVRKGTAIAEASFAHTIHVEAGGLAPSRWYWYQFEACGVRSPIGRTRTAPARDEAAPLRFAFASCQKYIDGYFTAFHHMADEEIDLVIHLGDYIYEGAQRKDRVRQHPPEEAVTLDQYRRRYALYKSDPDLQLAHARFPWAVVWDDHETADNYANMIPDWDSPVETFPQRRAAAYQAYYEHMPLRHTARPKGVDLLLYRSLPWGTLAGIQMLDTRQYRTDQPCGDKIKRPCPERNRPEATLFGDRQQQWLFERLHRSTAQWNILAQQVIFSQLDLDPGPGELYSMDKWDGYPAARERVLEFLEIRKPNNPVILAGDNHNHWAFDVRRDFRDEKSKLLAAEFVGTSITSNGDGEEVSSEYGAALSANPHIRFHNSRRGYVQCTVERNRWTTRFRTVPYVSRPGAPVETRASFAIEAGVPGIQVA